MTQSGRVTSEAASLWLAYIHAQRELEAATERAREAPIPENWRKRGEAEDRVTRAAAALAKSGEIHFSPYPPRRPDEVVAAASARVTPARE